MPASNILMNNDENPFGFKDKEIEKITSEITKASKHQLGESFQDAIARGGGETTAESPIEAPAETPRAPTPGLPPIETMGSDLGESGTPPDLHTGPIEIPSDEKTEEPVVVITPLQTYERDIAEAIRSNNESVTSINLAQQKRVQEKGTVGQRTEKIARKSLTLLISLVLIISAVGISALLYYFVKNRPADAVPVEPSLIITDERRAIDVTNLKAPAIAEKIKSEMRKPSAADSIVRIELTENVLDPASVLENPENPETITRTILPVTFFEFFALSSPPTLGRSLGSEWVFGFQNIENAIEKAVAPFIIVRVDSFDNAFEGMHRWEERMLENLGPILIKSEIKTTNEISTTTPVSNAATTSTVVANPSPVTATVPVIPTTSQKFQDVIIHSKDVRLLKNNSGNTILLYSFLDQKNLVITTNEKTFEELLNRFFSSQIVR